MFLFVLYQWKKKKVRVERYVAIDPLTGLRASGTTPDEAIRNLAGCGFAPYGFYFWRGEDDVVKYQITVNLEGNKLETAMAIMGYVSLGLMLTPIPGTETAGFVIGLAPMVYFTVSSASRLAAQIEHTGKLDIHNPQTWRDFGMLLTSAVGRGVIGTSMRTLGLSLMVVGDIEIGRRLVTETLKQSKTMTELEKKKLWQNFFNEELGPLAAALAMDFFILKGEAYLRYKEILIRRAPRTPPISADDLEAVITTDFFRDEEIGRITRQTIYSSYSPGRIPTISRYILPDRIIIDVVPGEGLRVRTPQDPNNTYIIPSSGESSGEPPTFVRTAANLGGVPEITWTPGVGGEARVGRIIVRIDGEGKILTKGISDTDKAKIESLIQNAKKTLGELSEYPQLIKSFESAYQDLTKKTEELLTAEITKTQPPEQSIVNMFVLPTNQLKNLDKIHNLSLLTLQTFRLEGGKVFFSSKVTLPPSQKEFLAKGIACANNILKTQDVFPLTPEMLKNIRKSKVLVLSDQEFNAVVGESCRGFYLPYTNLVCVPESLFRGGTLNGLTVLIHELLHSTGGRRASHTLLEEGTTELITRMILRETPLVSYIHEVAQVQYLRQLLGEEVVAEFYKTRNPEILFQKIEEIYGKTVARAIGGQRPLLLGPLSVDIKRIHSIQLAIKNAKEQGIEIPPEILDEVKAIAQNIANIERREYVIRYILLIGLTLSLSSSFYTIQILRQYLNKLKKQK
ncbi:MAG: hypothetical protein QXL47_01630 [Candidatus Anstonellales archaeon]